MSLPGEITLRLCARTDLGRTRDHNEDTFLVADLTRGTTDILDDGRASVGPRGLVFLVADGMGGAAAGELASAMAADAIFEHLRAAWTPSAADSGDDFVLRIREAVESANDRIHQYASEHPDSRGMGTTATVAGVYGGRLHLAQVGDSRAYLVRNGAAVQLTKDQSLMQRLIDAGELTEEQAAQSERRNIILQALGPDSRIRVDVTYQDLVQGDVLILCSDGLSGQVTRDDIGRVVNAHDEVETVCERLIELANERGGPDNITAVVARFDGPGLPGAESADEAGYHSYPLPEPEVEPELPEVTVPVPALQEYPDEEEAPPPVVRRTGSPVVIAAVGVLLLLALLALFLFFA
ncbi:MAG: PP2C family serine/threonine-protein phosphatase [Gemmatimonadales bacterium]